MASRRSMLLAAILVIISLDVSSIIVVVAAAVAWDPKTPRYDSFNLDKGPVFYEAYYPDDAYQEKRNYDRNTVLETSFQVPSDHFAYSAESAIRPVSTNKSFAVVDDEENLWEEQRKGVEAQRNYVTANKYVPFHDRRSIIFDDDKSPRAANIEEISKLVRRAITRDLENWDALERYLDRVSSRDQLMVPRPRTYFREGRENEEEDDDYSFRVKSRLNLDSSEQPSLKILRKLEARDVRPTYLEEVDASGSAMTSRMSVSDTRAVDAPIRVTSDPLPPENIFQPRPQIIRYTFFKKPATRSDGQIKEITDNSTPRSYGDNLIREEITDSGRDGSEEKKGDVKVTSIEVSELPHKTRHHHGEWPKRDYSKRRHRSSAGSPII